MFRARERVKMAPSVQAERRVHADVTMQRLKPGYEDPNVIIFTVDTAGIEVGETDTRG